DAGNRLDRVLASKRPLLTCYFPLGDPRMPPDVLQLYADCGVDIVELGVFIANPFMDGRDVAAAMARALYAGFSWDMLGHAAAALRARDGGPAALCMAYADMDVTAAATHPAWSMIDGL